MRHAVLALALLVLSGCDLFADKLNHDPISATGRIVLAGTGEPVVGLGVAIVGVTGGVASGLGQTRTDSTGRFSVRYDPPEPESPPNATTAVGYFVEANFPYDARYTIGLSQPVRPGDRIDAGTVEVERNETP
jgi:hypothetical protein